MMYWVLFGYVGLLPLLLFVLLCGDRPRFEGTWVERVHIYVFSGGFFATLQGVIRKLFGNKGADACSSLATYCYDRPNPVLQFFYLAIVAGSYLSISYTSLQYIPGPYLEEWHVYVGQGAVFFAIVFFLLTSFCDPGTINAATLPQHAASFPFDGIIYQEKECYTCKIPRPARSKHCSICNRCIARFDHHCGWMNSCVGEKNLRYFLGFLIWHVFLCWYGVYLLGAILLGEIQDKNVMRTIRFYYGETATEIYPHVLQWVIVFYSAQVLEMVFLAIVSLLLAAFALYHFYLLVTNTTTNETYKWDDYQRWQAEMAWSQMFSEESQKSAGENSKGASNKAVRKSGWLDLFRRSESPGPPRPKPSSFKKNNLYNRGLVANAAEVLYPLSARTKVTKVSPVRQAKKD